MQVELTSAISQAVYLQAVGLSPQASGSDRKPAAFVYGTSCSSLASIYSPGPAPLLMSRSDILHKYLANAKTHAQSCLAYTILQ